MNLDWTHGNRFALLENGEAFYPRVFEAIAQARREVLLETFILFDDKVGRQLQQALYLRQLAPLRGYLLLAHVFTGSEACAEASKRFCRDGHVVAATDTVKYERQPGATRDGEFDGRKQLRQCHAISGDTAPLTERPMKTSAPFMASARLRCLVFTACADFHWFMPSVRPW